MGREGSVFGDANDYAGFLNVLSGLIYDAETAGYSERGNELLREARDRFLADLEECFPNWSQQ